MSLSFSVIFYRRNIFGVMVYAMSSSACMFPINQEENILQQIFHSLGIHAITFQVSFSSF